MGKRVYLIISIIFTVITLIGVISVLAHTRNVNAGAAVIPGIIAIAFNRLYQKSK